MTTQSLVFIGSLNRETPYFQGARGPGLSVYALDETTLDATLLTETRAVDNPTFITTTVENGCPIQDPFHRDTDRSNDQCRKVWESIKNLCMMTHADARCPSRRRRFGSWPGRPNRET